MFEKISRSIGRTGRKLTSNLPRSPFALPLSVFASTTRIELESLFWRPRSLLHLLPPSLKSPLPARIPIQASTESVQPSSRSTNERTLPPLPPPPKAVGPLDLPLLPHLATSTILPTPPLPTDFVGRTRRTRTALRDLIRERCLFNRVPPSTSNSPLLVPEPPLDQSFDLLYLLQQPLHHLLHLFRRAIATAST